MFNCLVMNDSNIGSILSLDESFLQKIDFNFIEEKVQGGSKKIILEGSSSDSDSIDHTEHLSQNKNPAFDKIQATEVIADKSHCKLKFFGLPESVRKLLRDHKNIVNLYKWQEEVLCLGELILRKNLLLILPTSGGKTLIAELLILKEVLCNAQNVLFILPYISLVHEKLNSLSPFALELGFLIEEYAGNKGRFPPIKRRNKNTVFVATIEKADILVNSLIEVGRLDEIGLLVIDEFHLISQPIRGAIIEGSVVKVLHCNPQCQIIALSATLGNPKDLALFINGVLYSGNFRPVNLEEFVKIDDDIYKVNNDPSSDVLVFVKRFKNKASYNFLGIDPDMVGYLIKEVIPLKSCLVFCPTKRNCENLAELLCKTLSDKYREYKAQEKRVILKALITEGQGNVCKILQRTIPFGIAYHHSGLTTSERKIIEEAFLNNALCCICCTSTLAAGVNLPAARVILRSPFVGNSLISLSQYKQMVGRAGRAGLEAKGESYLICQTSHAHNIKNLLMSSINDCHSQLMGEPFSKLVLCCLFLKIANSRQDLIEFFKKTLLSKQSLVPESTIEEQIDNVLDDLLNSTTICRNDTLYELTKMGAAAVSGNFSVATAKDIYSDLIEAKNNLVLSSNLHLIYLITPYDIELNVTHDVLTGILLSLKRSDLAVANILGISEGILMRVSNGRNVPKRTKLVLKRLMGALMLQDFLEGNDLWEVSRKFGLDRGFIYSFVASTSSFASAILRFCEVFPEEFWCFSKLLIDFPQKIIFCCSQELIPLMELPAVRLGRARQMHRAGFTTISSIAAADPKDLSRSIDLLPLKQARLIVTSAKMLLIAKAEELQEAALGILEGVTK